MATSTADLERSASPWDQFINEAARRFDVPAAWIRQVMTVESGGRTTLHGRPITSRAGAMGLMQLMPGTYGDMRRALDLGSDPFDPHDNILAGTAYLRAMFDRFGNGVFAAYNAGPERYQAYLDGMQLLPSETVSYLAKLRAPAFPTASNVAMGAFTPSANALFFALSNNRAPPSGEGVSNLRRAGQPRHSPPTQKDNLFIPLSTRNR